jgi:hypothetical protein
MLAAAAKAGRQSRQELESRAAAEGDDAGKAMCHGSL